MNENPKHGTHMFLISEKKRNCLAL